MSFTKGEGFGRPLLEASLMQKPVIASGWSGHVDFLDKDMSYLLPGTLKPIHHSAVVPEMLVAMVTCPLPEGFDLYHFKTIDKQEKQNNYYNTI